MIGADYGQKPLPDAAIVGEAQEGVWQPDGRGRAEADLEAFGVPVYLCTSRLSLNLRFLFAADIDVAQPNVANCRQTSPSCFSTGSHLGKE